MVNLSNVSTQPRTITGATNDIQDLLDEEINFVGSEMNMEGEGTIRFKPIERGEFDSVMVYTAIFENWNSFKSMIAKIPSTERKH